MQREPIGPSAAKERTQQLLGYFHLAKDETRNVNMVIPGIAEVLAGYPEDVVVAVLSPSRGLPSKQTWLPSVAEVKRECDHWADEIGRGLHRATVIDQTRQLAAPDPKPRPSMDDLRARYGSNWGLTSAISTRKASFRPVGEIVEEWRKQREQANIQANSGAEGAADRRG